MMFGLVEFGHALWNYHMAEKATAIGARWIAAGHGVKGTNAANGELWTATVPDCFVNSADPPGTPCAQVSGATGWSQTCSGGGGGSCSGAVMGEPPDADAGEHAGRGSDRCLLLTLADVEAGPLHRDGALGIGHLGPVELDLVHAGQRPDAGADVALELRPQRAPCGGQRHRDRDVAVVADRGACTMPSSTMSRAELGVDHPAQRAASHRSVGAAWRRATERILPARPCKPGAVAVDMPATPTLDLLKALGDNTRYAIYLELARSAVPLATADVAESLGLHPNTVRPHLERMRDVGLLEVQADDRGGVGRPQHLYSLAADAPSLGLEPPTFPMLARMLLRAAAAAGAERRRRGRRRP